MKRFGHIWNIPVVWQKTKFARIALKTVTQNRWVTADSSNSTFGFNVEYRIFSNRIRSLFYSFRGLKNQMRITVACGLDSRSRAGFWKNDGAAVRAARTIKCNNLISYLLLIIIYCSSDSSSSLITESLSVLRRDCARLLRMTRFTVPVWIIGPRPSVGF